MKGTLALCRRAAESARDSLPNPQLLQERFRRALNFPGDAFLMCLNWLRILSFLPSKRCCCIAQLLIRLDTHLPSRSTANKSKQSEPSACNSTDVVAHFGHVGVNIRPEVSQHH